MEPLNRRNQVFFTLLKQKDSIRQHHNFDDKSFDDINNNKWHFHDFQFWFFAFPIIFQAIVCGKKKAKRFPVLVLQKLPTFLIIYGQIRLVMCGDVASGSKKFLNRRNFRR